MDDINKILFIREYEGNRASMLEVIAYCTHLVPLEWMVDEIDEISDEVGTLVLFNNEANIGIKVKPGDHVLIGKVDDDIVIRVIDDKAVAKKIERRMIKEFVIEEMSNDDINDKFVEALVDRIHGEQESKGHKFDRKPGSDKCYECNNIHLCLGLLISLEEYDKASDIIDVLKDKEE